MHNIPKLMRCSNSSSKGEVYSDKHIYQQKEEDLQKRNSFYQTFKEELESILLKFFKNLKRRKHNQTLL